GGVVLEMAADMPERVNKAILLDSVPPTGYPMFKKDDKGQPMLTQPLRTKEEIAADPVQVAPVLAAYASGNRDMLRAIWNAAIYNMNQPSPEDYELYLDAIFKQRNLVDIDYSLMTFNMTDSATLFSPGSGRLSKIECPVVLLHGEKDLVVPLAWARMAMGQIEGARMITFSDAGHSVLTDDLSLFADTVRNEMS
ncbi:MAG: alpha/beta hydrolase, partial [Clostridia bacterium]|nr:alpha/beta hydrolase [Clostridia bacterium]